MIDAGAPSGVEGVGEDDHAVAGAGRHWIERRSASCSISSTVVRGGAGFDVGRRLDDVRLPAEGLGVSADVDIALSHAGHAEQFVDGPGAREGVAAVDLHAARAGEDLVARVGLRGGGDGVGDAIHAASGEAEEFGLDDVGGDAGSLSAVHFDAVPGAPVGSKGVLRDFGALEAGLLAQVVGDIGVGVESCRATASDCGRSDRRDRTGAELPSSKRSRSTSRDLGLRDRERVAADAARRAAASRAMTPVRMTRSSAGKASLLVKMTNWASGEGEDAEGGENPGEARTPRRGQGIDAECGKGGGGELEDEDGGGRGAGLIEFGKESVEEALEDAVVAQASRGWRRRRWRRGCARGRRARGRRRRAGRARRRRLRGRDRSAS